MARLKFEWSSADTCLPDYWQGHKLPHVQIPVYRGMSLKAIKEAIKVELRQGYVMGNTKEATMLSADFVGEENADYADKVTKAAYAAVNRMKPNTKGKRTFFHDLEKGNFDCYAYFVLADIS